MSEAEILALATLFKGISETVWDLALLRVYAQSLQFAVWAILFFVAGTGMMFVSVRLKDDEMQPFAWLGASALFLVFGAFLAAFVGRAAAPEWYALEQIILHLG